MLVLTQEKLLEIVDGFATSIRVQLRARPLGVVVTDEWILDLARNMAGGPPGLRRRAGYVWVLSGDVRDELP